MILVGTFLNCSDNSGARIVQCIRIYKRKRFASIGDEILVTVKTNNPKKKIKRGELYRGLIIRTKYNFKNGMNYYKFNDNALVLLNKKKIPFATKLFGVSIKMIRFINRKVFLLLQNII